MVTEQLQEGVLLNDRYKIVRPLGQGGMGTVYLAMHERLDSPVAVKEIRSERTTDEEYRVALEQCAKEARFLVRLNHPNLPKVTDAFVENSRFYLVMEYIEGVTLEGRLWEQGGKPLDARDVVNWALQIADVLAYLHGQDPPIIFRDLKPANIMLQPDNNVRLIDFGIARRFQPGASKDTMLLGSVGYSPPEQFGKHQTDTRSDIYAFAATLHHLLTGRDPSAQPFKFPPARSLNLAVPETLSRLLDRCLSMESDARPKSIQEVAYSLMMCRDDLGRMPASVPQAAAVVDGAAIPRHPAVRPSGAQSGRRVPAQQQDSTTHTSPGGSARSAERNSLTQSLTSPRGMALAACAVALIGFPTFFFVSRPRHKTAPRLTTGVPQQSAAFGSAPVPPPEPNSAPPASGGGQGELPATHEAPPEVKPVLWDVLPAGQQGLYLITTIAGGTAAGRAGVPGVIAVYFFDAAGNPLPAREPSDHNYATREGQLCVARSVKIGGDDQFQSPRLDVPGWQFPASAASGIKYRYRLFLDNQKVAETEIADLPMQLPADFFGAQASRPADGSGATVGVGVSGGSR